MKINKNKSFGKPELNIVSLFIDNDVGSILLKLHDHFIKEVIPIEKGDRFQEPEKTDKQIASLKPFLISNLSIDP